jgi:hypothetical protein
MLPINRLDKFLFIFLYHFANSFKLYLYILAIYIAISIYCGINDGQIAIAFVFCFMCWDAKNLATECIHTWPADAL